MTGWRSRARRTMSCASPLIPVCAGVRVSWACGSPRQVFSAERIMEKVWGWDNEAEINVVWVNVSNLRKKLKAIGSAMTLRANRGLGYLLEEDV